MDHAKEVSMVFFTGAVLAFMYTGGPLPLKYYGLGDVVIFLCFGPLLQ